MGDLLGGLDLHHLLNLLHLRLPHHPLLHGRDEHAATSTTTRSVSSPGARGGQPDLPAHVPSTPSSPVLSNHPSKLPTPSSTILTTTTKRPKSLHMKKKTGKP